MNKTFRRRFSFAILSLIMVFTLIACNPTEDPEDPEDPVTYTVTFNSNGGSNVNAQTVEENETASKPSDPTLEGYTFEYWYLDDETVEFDFTTEIVANITLNAFWREVEPDGPTDLELIEEDINAIVADLYASDFELNLPNRGPNDSRITWRTTARNVSFNGLILPLYDAVDPEVQVIQGTFSLGAEKVVADIDVTIPIYEPIEIEVVKSVDFTNLTTEYSVEDGSINLYFAADGSVPYVSTVDFLNLLEGFVDPDVVFTFTQNIDSLEISYQYYDEDYDETYDLIVTIDATNDTITTNDPGFYWAYVYSTATNYGRHIEYDYDNPDASSEDGDDVIYELRNYNLEATIYDDQVLLPYYIVNQLFAGSSYYNVYYNQDGLFGIYSLPSSGSDEYTTMKTSSANGEALPVDLAIHNFNMLAFNLDYFYGLRDIRNVETYRLLLMDNLDGLLNVNVRNFDNSLFNFIYKTIDELHTSYGYPSYYNDIEWEGPQLTAVNQLGDRGKAWYGGTGYSDGLFNVQDTITAKWGSTGARPDYWFLDDDKTSVVLTLDGFSTADIEESQIHDPEVVADVLDVVDSSVLFPEITSGDKIYYYNTSTQEMNRLEVLIKGSNESYVDTYKQDLLDLGFTHVVQPTSYPSKAAGYYIKVVDDVEYMALVSFDQAYQLVYIGITNDLPTSYAASWPVMPDARTLINRDSAVYLEFLMDEILSETSSLVNVTIDLTYNTGGNVGALYRVVGFVTDQPFRVSRISKDTNGSSSNYVLIDGVPTYPELNWSLLTSKVTFSAANSLATIFKENNLGPVIGVRSGGGTSSITPILLPSGTAFTMSSNSMSAYRTGSGTDEDPYVYHHNEFGIIPDYNLFTADLYDAAKILDILNEN